MFSLTQLQQIIGYAQLELRTRFDNTHSDFEAISIIEEARLMGFTALGDEMIIDLSTSQDNMSEKFIRDLVAKHEEKNYRDYEPDNGEVFTFQIPTELKEKRA